MEKASNKYEDVALLRCGNESEIVNVYEFVPRVSLTVDLFPGTKNYRRMTLQWLSESDGYRAEIYGRYFSSRGPRVRGNTRTAVSRKVLHR